MTVKIKIDYAESIDVMKLLMLVDGEVLEDTFSFSSLNLSEIDDETTIQDKGVIDGVEWTRITFVDELDSIEKFVKGRVSKTFNYLATIKDYSFNVFFDDKRIILEKYYKL